MLRFRPLWTKNTIKSQTTIDHLFILVNKIKSTILLTISSSSGSKKMKSHFNNSNSMREQMGILIPVTVEAILTGKEATILVALVSIKEHSIMVDNVLKINQPLLGRKVKTVIEVGVVKVTVLPEVVPEAPRIVLDTTELINSSRKTMKVISIIITTIKVPKVSGAEEANFSTIKANTTKNTKMIGKTSSFLSSNTTKAARTSTSSQSHRKQIQSRS